jgi:E3 ubiquitin-protein ligase DRIP
LCLLIISRPDHNLQDIRTKIFPFKHKKVQAEEVVPSTPLPAKRKERSLSSLVVSAPKVSTHTSFTGKRTKSGTRKAAALRGCSFTPEESIKKEEAHDEDNLVTAASTSFHMFAHKESHVRNMGH